MCQHSGVQGPPAVTPCRQVRKHRHARPRHVHGHLELVLRKAALGLFPPAAAAARAPRPGRCGQNRRRARPAAASSGVRPRPRAFSTCFVEMSTPSAPLSRRRDLPGELTLRTYTHARYVRYLAALEVVLIATGAYPTRSKNLKNFRSLCTHGVHSWLQPMRSTVCLNLTRRAGRDEMDHAGRQRFRN